MSHSLFSQRKNEKKTHLWNVSAWFSLWWMFPFFFIHHTGPRVADHHSIRTIMKCCIFVFCFVYHKNDIHIVVSIQNHKVFHTIYVERKKIDDEMLFKMSCTKNCEWNEYLNTEFGVKIIIKKYLQQSSAKSPTNLKMRIWITTLTTTLLSHSAWQCIR